MELIALTVEQGLGWQGCAGWCRDAEDRVPTGRGRLRQAMGLTSPSLTGEVTMARPYESELSPPAGLSQAQPSPPDSGVAQAKAACTGAVSASSGRDPRRSHGCDRTVGGGPCPPGRAGADHFPPPASLPGASWPARGEIESHSACRLRPSRQAAGPPAPTLRSRLGKSLGGLVKPQAKRSRRLGREDRSTSQTKRYRGEQAIVARQPRTPFRRRCQVTFGQPKRRL